MKTNSHKVAELINILNKIVNLQEARNNTQSKESDWAYYMLLEATIGRYRTLSREFLNNLHKGQ